MIDFYIPLFLFFIFVILKMFVLSIILFWLKNIIHLNNFFSIIKKRYQVYYLKIENVVVNFILEFLKNNYENNYFN